MNRATKALLLSALVFPGAGHLFLKRYLRGAGLLAVTLAGLAVIVVESVHKALAIADKLQRGEVPLDLAAITGLLAQSTSGSAGLVLDIATYLVTLCWLVGVFDSYRIGKRQDGLDDKREGAGHPG